MVKRFFNFETKSINAAAFLLFLSGLASRLMGLFRDGLLAGYFGGGRELDIYFAAFRVPDFIYNILIGGGIALVFLPLFAEYYTKDKEKAWKVANLLLNVFLTFLFVLAIITFFLAPILAKLIAPGFNSEELALLTKLMRIMLLSPILFGGANLFSGILQYFNRFLIYSFAPLLYNLGIILSIIFFAPSYGIIGVSWGVIGGAFLYFLIQFIAAKFCGFKWQGIFSLKSKILRKSLYLIIPRIFASAAQQINLIVVTAIASTLGRGSIAVFNFANNLQYIPMGLVATPFALAAFPAFSRLISQKNHTDFSEKLTKTISKILFFVLPLSVMLYLLRAQVVRLVLGSMGEQRFDWIATRLTAASLGAFCFGIFAAALIPLIARAFFALQDTKTPALISVFTVALNIGLCFLFVLLIQKIFWVRQFVVLLFDLEFIKDIAVIGLPLAFSFSAILQLFLLLYFLARKVGDFGLKKIIKSVNRIAFITFISGLNTYFFLQVFANIFNTRTVIGLFLQTIFAGGMGLLIYFFLAWFMNFEEIKELRKNNEKH